MPYKAKQALSRAIQDHGGVVSHIVGPGTTHFVADSANINSIKARKANKLGLPALPPQYIDDCIAAKSVLSPHVFANPSLLASEALTKGSIAAPVKQKLEKKVFAPLISFPVYDLSASNIPDYPADEFDVAKFSLLQRSKAQSTQREFACIELHVASPDTKLVCIR